MIPLLIASVLAAACLLPTPAIALPDLSPEIYETSIATGQTVAAGDVADGCAASTGGRTLVRFGVRSWNVGTDPLVLGDTGCPDCTISPPGTMCTNPDFECSPSGTPRAVFLSSSRYELLDLAGNVVAAGAKRNYCFLDDCVPPAQRTYGDCQHNQGVSAGCYDDYEPELDCQYIDATDVPGIGTRAFRLRVTIDPDNLLPDANRGNNVTEVVLPGCGDGVLQSGEDCDVGALTVGTCCDASCHFVAAGTTCRATTGPCDAAEACDGASASCPADASVPDGTPCGAGTPPCVVASCRGGQCVSQQDTARGCLVDGACFPPGATDPVDPCRRCDPSASADAWTPVRDPDAQGITCGVKAVSLAARGTACARETIVERRAHRAAAIAGRLADARPAAALKLTGRLLRIVERSIRLVDGGQGCSSQGVLAALQALRDQLQAMRATLRAS